MIKGENVKRFPGKDENQKLTLLELNLDILTSITSYLDCKDLANLEQTCRTLNESVQNYGWKSILDRQRVKISFASSSHSTLSAKEIIRVDRAWRTCTFVASQCVLEKPLQRDLGKSVYHRHTREQEKFSLQQSVPFCQVHLVSHGLILLMQSELHYWPTSELEKPFPITMESSQIFRLENPANMDVNWINDNKNSRKPRVSPIWDICASAILNEQGTLVALARVNGLIEIVKMYSNGQRSNVRLAWFWPDLMNTNITIQSLTSCPVSGLLAICSKQGQVWLICVRSKKKFQSVAGNRRSKDQIEVQAISHWNLHCRIWSACFGVAKLSKRKQRPDWLAIGTASREGILIYPFEWESQSFISKEIVSIPCQEIAVYSMKSMIVQVNGKSQEYLFAGCFDGRLRTYNVSRISKGKQSPTSSFQMYDKFDPSAIYSLCILGKGREDVQIAAGTSRHGIVKMFCLNDENHFINEKEDTSKQDQNWSMFTANPSHSPTYSLTGSFDRLFGVTDQKLWQIDLRKGAKMIEMKRWKGNELSKGSLAYYRHQDMLLENSRLPSWIDQLEEE